MRSGLVRKGRTAALAAAMLLVAAAVAEAQRADPRDSARADRRAGPDTTSTVSVAPADIPFPQADPLRVLAGRVPGTLVTGASGRPGAAPGARLGGYRAPVPPGTSQPPLYVVDGVTVYAGLPAIDPLEIERLDVVTGQAAAPRYGSRAANGVVVVSSVSGADSRGALDVRFRSEGGTSDVERGLRSAREHPLLMDPQGRFCVADATAPLCARTFDWTTEAARVNGLPADTIAAPSALVLDPGRSVPASALRQAFASSYWPTPVYDASRQVTTAAPFVRAAVDVSGRAGGTAWLAAFSRLRERGSIRSLDGATRSSARVNLDQRLGHTLAVALRGWYGHDRSDGFSQQDAGSLFTALTELPASADLLARDPQGRLYPRPNLLAAGLSYPNPLLYTTGNGVTDELTTERLLGGASVRWSPREWLDVEASAGYDRRSDRWDYALPTAFRDVWTALVHPAQVERWRDATRTTALGATAHRDLGTDLAAVWMLRVVSERHSASARYDWVLLTPGAEGQPPDTQLTIRGNADVSQRLSGILAGASLAYRRRYVADLLLRRDAYTLGEWHGHATLARAGLAWRASAEPWWPLPGSVGALSLRASLGRTGSAPTYPLTADQLLDSVRVTPDLRGPTVSERSAGADLELFRRITVGATWTHTDTRDLALTVPFAGGVLGTTYMVTNVGSLHGSSWELSLDVPVARGRDVTWSWRFTYDRSRAEFGALILPPFLYGGPVSVQPGGSYLLAREGERYGMLYGSYFLRGAKDCARLPLPFSADCGTASSSFQVNGDGWLVWVGRDAAGNAFHAGDGVTRNLWMTTLPAAAAPWGAALDWGMPILLRDSAGAGTQVPLGSVVPTWHFSVSQDLRWHRLRVFALLEGVMGRHVWNLARQRALAHLTAGEVDQRGADPAVAKPIGYYVRGIGTVGGRPTNASVEGASFAKLREVSVTYHLGRVGGVGSWDVALIGRNVVTLTRFRGLDLESGISGGPYGTGTLDVGEATTFPNLRTLSVGLSTAF